MMKLKGKVALITGGGTGIGKAIAEAFASEGSNLVISYFDKKEETENLSDYLEDAYGVEIKLTKVDVTNEEQVKRMIEKAIDYYGKIDVLVNNAGILQQVLLKDMDSKAWDRMIDTNLKGVFLCCKYVLPHMIKREYGRIINISSQLAQIGGAALTHYCAAKAGVIGFSKSLAREVGGKGITVNCIAPGPIETDLIKDLSEEWKETKKKELVIPRFGKPEEIAPTAVLLASEPDGNLYTGQTLGPNSGDVMV